MFRGEDFGFRSSRYGQIQLITFFLPPSSDIAIWAKSFGATVIESLNSKVTHLVAARVCYLLTVMQASPGMLLTCPRVVLQR